MAPPPNIPENPAIFPSAPDTPATSIRAPPIAVRPFPISDHFIDPNFSNPSDNSLRELTTMFIETAPNILEKPPNLLITFVTFTISARAPPMETNP